MNETFWINLENTVNTDKLDLAQLLPRKSILITNVIADINECTESTDACTVNGTCVTCTGRKFINVIKTNA